MFTAIARTSLSVMKTGLWKFIAAASLAASNNADASASMGCMIRRNYSHLKKDTTPNTMSWRSEDKYSNPSLGGI
jgi:hypothetical protein